MGNKFLHIYSDTTTSRVNSKQCNDRNCRQCLIRNIQKAKPGFALDFWEKWNLEENNLDQTLYCRSSTIFYNRICDVGGCNKHWSLSLSQEVRTGRQIMEHGTFDAADNDQVKSIEYCPCVFRPDISLSLNLLQTCKQIHEEAALIPYETNTFAFQGPKTFAAFFHLMFHSSSTYNRSSAVYNMRHIHLRSRFVMPHQFLELTRLLRASLPLLTSLQTLELTVGMEWPAEWEVDDSFFGLSQSVKKVTVNVQDRVANFNHHCVPGRTENHWCSPFAVSIVDKQQFAEKLVARILKREGFPNQAVLFLGPV